MPDIEELCEMVEALEPRRPFDVTGTSCVEDLRGGRAGDGWEDLRVGRGGGAFRASIDGDFEELVGRGWSLSTGGGGRSWVFTPVG